MLRDNLFFTDPFLSLADFESYCECPQASLLDVDRLIGGAARAASGNGWMMARSGHGELITLCGLFLALVIGWTGFESVGLKGDLGALLIGGLVGEYSKSKELAKSLAGLTDLLLVGFFLSIGLKGLTQPCMLSNAGECEKYKKQQRKSFTRGLKPM